MRGARTRTASARKPFTDQLCKFQFTALFACIKQHITPERTKKAHSIIRCCVPWCLRIKDNLFRSCPAAARAPGRAGGAAALAPRTCEGGATSPQIWWRGEYEFPTAESEAELSFCFCRPYFSSFFVKDMQVTGSPRYQCALLLSPPS